MDPGQPTPASRRERITEQDQRAISAWLAGDYSTLPPRPPLRVQSERVDAPRVDATGADPGAGQ